MNVPNFNGLLALRYALSLFVPSVFQICLLGLIVEDTLRADDGRDPSPSTSSSVPSDHADRAKQGLEIFQSRVRDILTDRCLSCHGGDSVKADFDLSTRELLMESGSVGPTAAESRLMDLINHTDEPKMPLNAEPLSEQEIQAIAQWIELGAVYDGALIHKEDNQNSEPLLSRKVTEHDRLFWSFQRLAPVEIPSSKLDSWCRSPIDRFVLAKQEEAGLAPNTAADRRTLIRRATFDLWGLPADPDAVEAFVADQTPDAWPRLVAQLLESPHYGERWARHWMDIARYADSHGYENDYDRPYAYHYRDFLIRAFNQDMPYDQFLRWQIAGDEFAPGDPLALSATGFLGAGAFPTQLTEAEFESARYDELDDIVTTTGVAFLGLTIGCARCHDHKFDPISSIDYYQLAANFSKTIRSEIELDLQPEENKKRQLEWESKLRYLQNQLSHIESEIVPAQFRTWLESYDPAVQPERWQTLKILNIESTQGSKYEALADGSWLASGTVPENDELIITAETHGVSVARIKLDALSHESLPRGGPGRSPRGSLALSDIQVSVAIQTMAGEDSSYEPEQQIELSKPMDSSLRGNHASQVGQSEQGKPIGSRWMVSEDNAGRDQAVVFQLSKPSSTVAGARWKLKLKFNHRNPAEIVGRIRLFATDSTSLPLSVGATLSQDIQESLRIAKDTGNGDSPAWELSQAWFANNCPQWVSSKQALEQHLVDGAAIQLTKAMISTEGLLPLKHDADYRGFPHFYPNVHFLIRGDVHQKQNVVEAGYLTVLQSPHVDPSKWAMPIPTGCRTTFRRASLANWMTDAKDGAGSLVARVMVNRLWQHHFGRGLVATPNDFGVSGSPPSHPELLDWLALDLIHHGWQLKRLHQMIMCSSVYLQCAKLDDARVSIDPENQWLWRWRPRRLEAEVIRDSMLKVAGRLDVTPFGPGSLDSQMLRRSVYFKIKRSELIPMMMLLDWPEHLVSIGQRSTTTIAPQALMFLNNKQVRDNSEAFAARLPRDSLHSAITDAYRHAFAREPSQSERRIAHDFIVLQEDLYQSKSVTDPQGTALADFCQSLLSQNEFVYIE